MEHPAAVLLSSYLLSQRTVLSSLLRLIVQPVRVMSAAAHCTELLAVQPVRVVPAASTAMGALKVQPDASLLWSVLPS